MKLILAAAALALAPVAALGHAQLESASPPVGGTVAAPQELRLAFSEAVEPKFSSVALKGAAGAQALGKPALAPGDAKVLVVKIGKPLAPGVYTVDWRAVSVDTHRTQGSFSFTVK